jgi:hypothetical protein
MTYLHLQALLSMSTLICQTRYVLRYTLASYTWLLPPTAFPTVKSGGN